MLWSKKNLEDFGILLDYVPLLYDNVSVVNMAKNLVQYKKTKHIDIRCYFLKDNIEKGMIQMVLCNTEEQIADIFTKEFGMEQFEKNRMKLNLTRQSLLHIVLLIPLEWL